MEQTELTPGPSWMFHDSQVGDEELARAIFEVIQPRLETLAAWLFVTVDDAAAWLVAAIARSVVDRRRYWGRQSLVAWVLGRAPGVKGARPLPLLVESADASAVDRCVAQFLVEKTTQRAFDPWTAAALAHLVDVDEAAAGAKCTIAEMKWRCERLENELAAHCMSYAGWNGSLAPQSNSDADSSQAGSHSAHQSLASVFHSTTFTWPAWETKLALRVNTALVAERRRRAWRLHLAEAGLVVVLAAAAYLTGRYASYQSAPAGAVPTNLAAQNSSVDIIYYTVRAGDSLENISARLHLPVAELLALNNLTAGSTLVPGQRLRLPYASMEQRPPEALLFTPRAPPTKLPPDAPIDSVLERSADSMQLWQTLWADVQVIDYGPVGYYGLPQQVLRKQVWISQPDYARIIYGPLTALETQTGAGSRPPLAGEPDGTLVVSAGLLFGHDFHNGATYRDLTSELLPDLDLQKLFLPPDLPPGVNVFNRGEIEVVAGRPALVMDAYNPAGAVIYRYWIDEQYGVVLRRREYSGADPEVALRDIVVTRIVIGSALPVEVFNSRLYRGDRFVLDQTGLPEPPASLAPALAQGGSSGHEPLPVHAAPPGYDPSAGRLSFQWSMAPIGGESYLPGLELFADGNFLGRVDFPEALSSPQLGSRDVSSAILPSILICKRSPDGKRLALSLLPAVYASHRSLMLFVIDLLAPENASPVIPGMSSLGDFAFSNDGSQLAFFACRENDEGCGVFLKDLSAAEQAPRSLMVVDFADYFLWSPDGELLGFLAAQGIERSWSYLVVRLADGEIVDQGGFDWRRLVPAQESQAAVWTDGSPVQAGGLEECAAPP